MNLLDNILLMLDNISNQLEKLPMDNKTKKPNNEVKSYLSKNIRLNSDEFNKL